MREALALLTPFGGARALSPRAVPWFPWVGALVGVLVGGSWWVAGQLWPPAVAAALVVVIDLAATGMLHLDGLTDTGDGLLPHLDRERRLAVMAEPGIGAFGAGVAFTALLLRWAALASMDPRPASVIGLWVLGRLVMTLAVVLMAPARAAGMGALVAGAERHRVMWSSVLALGVAVGCLAGGPGSVAPLAGALGGIGVLALANRRIGGVSGDVLGAACLVTETIGLVIAAARW